MLRKAALTALVGLLLPLPAAAQDLTLEDVLDSYYEAIGGLDAWEAVQSMKINGTMTLRRGMEAPFTRYVKRPDKVRTDFTVQGMTMIQAYDGETAWAVVPFRGGGEPQTLDARRARGLQENADLDGVLVGHEAAGYQVELMGLEEADGTEAYKLKVTLASGDELFYYLESEYFLPIKIEGTRMVQGNEIEFATTLSGYKEVDGLLIAHSIETVGSGGRGGGGQVVTYDTIELDVEIDDSIFAMPESEGGQR